MSFNRWSVIVLVVFVASASAVAAVLPPKPVSKLAVTADTIVAAKASIGSSGELSGTVIFLEVGRVLKGEAGSTITVTVSGVRGKQGNLDSAVISGVRTNSYGVWFLKNAEFGPQLLPVSDQDELAFAFPALPEVPAELLELSPSSPEERVLVELAAVAASGLEDAGAFFAEATYGSDTSIGLQVLQRLTQSTHQEARIAGLSGLIMRNQPSGLIGFESELMGIPKPSRIRRSTVLRDLIIIGIADEYRNDEVVGIEVLGRLSGLVESWPQVSEAASMALRAIHSRETLPFLKALLDSPNPTIRFNAVFGIASFANGLPVAKPSNIADMRYLEPQKVSVFKSEETMRNIPSIDAFRRDPEYYVNYWRNWLDSHIEERLP